MKNIYMVGNTHFDPVWLWRWDEAMASIHSTFRSALDRISEDESFIYSFATPPVFEWIKQTDPEMFDEIKARVDEGRWELPEGWWLQPDCFSASGESYARQSLYGQRYLLENFGKISDTVFNIDSFGHNSQIPQILVKSGMDKYMLCRPENKHLPIAEPFFKWIGKDGSALKAFRAGQYSEVYSKDMNSAVNEAEKRMENAACDEIMVYGVTNHGGAPTKKAISDIRKLAGEKEYGISFSSVSGAIENQGEPAVNVNGEMLTGDFGPYVNGVGIKKLNRIAEYAALNAEKAATLAKRMLGREYPKEKLDNIWKDIMFNQFHDILGGASTKDAYFDAYAQLGRAITNANEITNFSLGAITHKIKMPGKNPDNPWNLVVWNLNASSFNGYVEGEMQWLHEFPEYKGGIVLEDEQGIKYPCQIIMEGSVIEGFRSRVLFKTEITGLGYKCFKVVKTDKPDSISDYKILKSYALGELEIEFDKKSGFISTIKNTNSGKVFNAPVIPSVFEDTGDTWCFNVSGYGKQIGSFRLESLEVTEKGIHRITIKTVHSCNKSLLTLYYTLYSDGYLDIKYVANWNEKHTVLKLDCNFGYENLTVSSPFASENRGDTERDNPMSEWLTLTGNDGGVAMLFDGAFAYNKKGASLGVSLLRSCIYGDLRISELDKNADYPYMEQGITEGKIRIIPFDYDIPFNIADKAAAFNNPPRVICEANHDGMFESSSKFVKLCGNTAFVTAIKGAYDGEDEIIRLCEYFGKEQSVTLDYFGEKIDVNLMPYEIKTLKICDGAVNEVNIIEQ